MAMALEAVEATPASTIEPTSSSPRISFSADFLDANYFISINPHFQSYNKEKEAEEEKARVAEFEFLSSEVSSHAMLTADELFFEGKLLPFWQIQHSEKLDEISLETKLAEQQEEEGGEVNKEESRANWFVDDDPSPRPPKCTVLWKELLKLKKQRASSLSSSSSSSSSISSSGSGWLADIAATADDQEGKEGSGNRDKHVKGIKKRLERTRSASIRIRPLINVPICTQVKSTALPKPLLFPPKKGRFERRRTHSHG